MTSASTFGLVVAGTSGGQELILCPFHSDKIPSAWWSPRKDLFWCAVCNLGLNADQLAQRLGVEWEGTDERWEREPEEYDMVSVKAEFTVGVHNPTHPYIQERGIKPETAGFYDLRVNYANLSIVLPITNLQGFIVGIQNRYYHPEASGVRYKTYGETQPLWPMVNLKLAVEGRYMLIFEGAWSAMKVHQFMLDQWGVMPSCMALLGAKASQDIVDVLAPFKPVIMYDGDRAGKEACKKMRKLAPGIPSFTLSKSPDDMSEEEIGMMLEMLKERVE